MRLSCSATIGKPVEGVGDARCYDAVAPCLFAGLPRIQLPFRRYGNVSIIPPNLVHQCRGNQGLSFCHCWPAEIGRHSCPVQRVICVERVHQWRQVSAITAVNQLSTENAIVFGEKPPACHSIAGLMAVVSTPRAGLCQARSSARRYPRRKLLPTHCRWGMYSREYVYQSKEYIECGSCQTMQYTAAAMTPASTHTAGVLSLRPPMHVHLIWFVKQCGNASDGARQNGSPSPACTIFDAYDI